MTYLPAFVRLFSLFALVGTLIVSTIAAEFTMIEMSKATTVAMDEMAGTMGDMPCCPDEQPVKPDCDRSCPFVIICSTSAPIALLKADWTPASVSWNDQVYGERSFARLSSLAAEAPARPPKS